MFKCRLPIGLKTEIQLDLKKSQHGKQNDNKNYHFPLLQWNNEGKGTKISSCTHRPAQPCLNKTKFCLVKFYLIVNAPIIYNN